MNFLHTGMTPKTYAWCTRHVHCKYSVGCFALKLQYGTDYTPRPERIEKPLENEISGFPMEVSNDFPTVSKISGNQWTLHAKIKGPSSRHAETYKWLTSP